MTDEPRSGADLIDEAEREAALAFADRDAALERLGAVLAERDQLARLHEVATERVVGYAAVIEQAPHGEYCKPWREVGDPARCTCWKASADTDAALREVRAAAWDAGFACANSPFGVDPEAPNPYRENAGGA